MSVGQYTSIEPSSNSQGTVQAGESKHTDDDKELSPQWRKEESEDAERVGSFR